MWKNVLECVSLHISGRACRKLLTLLNTTSLKLTGSVRFCCRGPYISTLFNLAALSLFTYLSRGCLDKPQTKFLFQYNAPDTNLTGKLRGITSNMAEVANSEALKSFKRIPVYVVEEHNDALQFIYNAIGGKKLPVEGNTLLHLDAHPDMLISRKLRGEDARAGRKLLPLLEIENWIVPAAAAGHIGRVVWLRPPWAHQMADGTRQFRVGDDPRTGLLRVDSTEPYYLSDALYTPHLNNKRTLTLTVAELGDPNCQRAHEEEHTQNLVKNLEINSPYILDIDLDFFSTLNPFLKMYETIGLYDKLEPIFDFRLPADDYSDLEKCVDLRESQLKELEDLFQFLEERGSLEDWIGKKNALFHKVKEVSELVQLEADRVGQTPDWWLVYAAGCTRDQAGLPHHRTSRGQLHSLVTRSLRPLLRALPPPTLITIARSADDGYCPHDQVDEIQSLVLEELKAAYDIPEPYMHYKHVM